MHAHIVRSCFFFAQKDKTTRGCLETDEFF